MEVNAGKPFFSFIWVGTLLKTRLFCEISKNNFFHRTPLVAVSECLYMDLLKNKLTSRQSNRKLKLSQSALK